MKNFLTLLALMISAESFAGEIFCDLKISDYNGLQVDLGHAQVKPTLKDRYGTFNTELSFKLLSYRNSDRTYSPIESDDLLVKLAIDYNRMSGSEEAYTFNVIISSKTVTLNLRNLPNRNNPIAIVEEEKKVVHIINCEEY